MNTPNKTIPSGYREDATGRLIPESMIKPVDLKRNELVCVIAEQAKAMQAQLREFKVNVFYNINAFVDFSAKEYGVTMGGKKGNITLYSFDGAFKVQLSIAEHMVFDERLQAAKHLIDECITEWSQGSRDEIKVLVQDAFQTDKEGKINTGRVLGLRRLDIKGKQWMAAMQAISESLQVVGSKEYVRFYERIEGTDEYRPISLDVAAL
jgi:hypothetical protein